MKTDLERFNEKINKAGEIQPHVPHLGRCWQWLGAIHKNGYGMFWNGKKTVKAHRFSYLKFVGTTDRLVLHKCDNKSCVNPEHLFSGNHSDNAIDFVSKGMHYESRKTHCDNGHEYTTENTIISGVKRKQRRCKICHTKAQRKYELKRSAIDDARKKNK